MTEEDLTLLLFSNFFRFFSIGLLGENIDDWGFLRGQLFNVQRRHTQRDRDRQFEFDFFVRIGP
jgi:hypothetical protein